MADNTASRSLPAILEQHRACDGALRWARKQRPRALKAAWLECPRGDWLLWIAARIGVERKLLVMGACACARLALRYVPKGEARPLECIEVTEAWRRGEATVGQVREARGAAAAYAATAYAAAAAANAAYAATAAAANAATAATAAAANAAAAAAAANAAYAATAYAAAAAADAADAADAAALRRMRVRTAAAVREAIPWRAVRAALEGRR